MGSGSSKKRRSISVSGADSSRIRRKMKQEERARSVPANLSSFDPHSQKLEDELNNFKTDIERLRELKSAKKVPPSNLKPQRFDTSGALVSNEQACTATELYNILVAESWSGKLQISSEKFLLLIDCREQKAYDESHISHAKHKSCLHSQFGFLLHIPDQIQAFTLVIIYNDSDGSVGKSLDGEGVEHRVVTPGFNDFNSKYPFLCPRPSEAQLQKTWPSEILEGSLYQGNAEHVRDENIIKTLGITHIINVTKNHPNSFPGKVKYLKIELDDEKSADLLSWLPHTYKFIYDAIKNGPHAENDSVFELPRNKTKHRVLVHCNLGRSRSSTVVLAYLVKSQLWSLLDASNWLKDCRQTAKPNVGFTDQLLLYEKQFFGSQLSEFTELPF